MNTDKKKNNSKAKIYILGFLLLFAVLYVYIYIVPQVSDIFVDTYVAEYGTLESATPAECLFVRDEQVYTASAAGTVKKVISQGKLVRKGTKVATIGGSACYTEERGVISYFYDGLEQTLTPDKLDSITIESLEKAKEADFEVKNCKSKSAEAGDKLFKVVDNKEWYLVTWLTAEDAEEITEGKSVSVDFNDGICLKMKVKSVTTEAEKQKIVLACNRYYEFFDKYRIRDCRLIKSSRTGILLESSSIIEEEGQKGVYVKDKFGNYNFTPVSILGSEGGMTAVEKNYYYDAEGQTVATVKNYDEILKVKNEGE